MYACVQAMNQRSTRTRDEYERNSNRSFARGAMRSCALYLRILNRAWAHNEGRRGSSCYARNLERLRRHRSYHRGLCDEIARFAREADEDAEEMGGTARRLSYAG